jgi:hypothetical protein
MAFTGVMPAVDLIAPRYGLEAGATVIKHGEDEQTWGAGFQQENGLCGIRGETWVWCGAVANAGTPVNGQLPSVPLDGFGTDGGPPDLDSDPEMRQTELTGDEGDALGRWEQVYPFLVQAEDACAAEPGNTLHARRPETRQHLLDVLEFLSIKGAERELWVGGSNQDAKALTRQATSVGTGLKPKPALGAVEEAMAACLPGVMGTIHIPPGLASLLDNSLQDIDGDLYTFAGSRVVVGAGYAGQSPGDATHSAIYGTGPVIVHLGPTSMVTDELAQMANVQRNEFHLRAERLVAVTFDGCCHVGATVSLT